jgi:hypothetical protein
LRTFLDFTAAIKNLQSKIENPRLPAAVPSGEVGRGEILD